MFGRATITLSIDPHSSAVIFLLDEFIVTPLRGEKPEYDRDTSTST